MLAAGLPALSGWRPGTPLYDPMCGSGTFSTEAALWASVCLCKLDEHILPSWNGATLSRTRGGRFDRSHGFHRPSGDAHFRLGSTPRAVRQTMESLKGADVESLVQVKQADFFKLEPRTDGGMLVFNPPYGERMDPGDVVGLYERIGDRLKFHWSGFDAWVISSNDEALKRVGLRPHKRHPVFNGALECRWLGFYVQRQQSRSVQIEESMSRPWVLVSGASSGFGEASAVQLAKEGWNLMLTSRREDRLAAVADACRTFGAEVHVEAWDMRQRQQTSHGVETLMSRAGIVPGQGGAALNGLVNNAGLAVGKGPFDEGLDDDWDRMIDTNVKGLLFLARACVPFMTAGSRMVNMGSIAGKQVYPGGNVYCASKHAVDALSRAMRIDLVERDWRESDCPAPGPNSATLQRRSSVADAVYRGFEPLVAQDIAEAVSFVLSRPPHVCINDMVIMPTAQASAHHLYKVTS